MDNIFNLTDGLFDSHCHLNDPSYDTDRDAVVAESVSKDVMSIIDIGIDIESSRRAIDNALRFPGQVWASVGIDMECLVPGSDLYNPRLTPADFPKLVSELDEMISAYHEQVRAIGETGIDAYWLGQKLKQGEITSEQMEANINAQEELFRLHLELAVKHDLPLSVHPRAAEQRVLDIVKQYPAARGVFHSFTADYEIAKRVRDSGWGLGVNGIVTFNSAGDLRDTYRRLLGKVSSDWTPSDFYNRGVYFETDGPFLSPQGKRGERNVPGNVLDIYSMLLELG